MSLANIENMPAAELKANRESLVAESAKEPVEQLAARYVQARTDAALRDEKLSEQGRTITLLQESLTEAKALLQKREAEIRETERQLQAEKDTNAANVGNYEMALTNLRDNMTALAADLSQRTSDLAAATQLAAKRKAALVDVLKLVGDVNAKAGACLVEEV